jgi:ectoine hydroxylase-related dioxygenase (phytanoyl-CoA dioxygenase family)
MIDAEWGEFPGRGALVVRGLLDEGWIDVLRGVADDILETADNRDERLSGAAVSRSRSADGIWRTSEPFVRVLQQSPLADAAGTALGSASVTLYEDLFLYTDPSVPGASWHRDAPHWPLMGQQICSIWLSLEPVEIDTGALHFVAGSHHDADDVVRGETMTSEEASPDDRDIVGFATEPGDAVVFHPRIRHAALGAAPERPRRTFTIRMVGDDVRWRPRSAYYHPWMVESGLHRGDRLSAHPWFPVLRGEQRPVTALDR